jgi:hypothetical protein
MREPEKIGVCYPTDRITWAVVFLRRKDQEINDTLPVIDDDDVLLDLDDDSISEKPE